MTMLILLIAGSVSRADVCSQVTSATKGFRDISLTGRVLFADSNGLRKIGKDFGKSYDFKTCKIQYKAPDKMKMQGNVGLVNVSVIMNGDRKCWSVPSMHIHKIESIKGEPHKRQTEFDLGILTGEFWRDYVVTETTEEQGNDGPVYKMEFVRSNAKKRTIVCWIDARSLKMLKQETYDRKGRVKARFIYSGHKEVDGIWVPTRIDVYNRDGKHCAATAYEHIRVNEGIPDSVFAF